MSNLDVTVIRIDPYKKTAAKLVIRGRHLANEVRRVTRAKQLGHKKIMDIEEKRVIAYRQGKNGKPESYDGGPTPLMVAAEAEAEKGTPGWRLLGGEVTVGYGCLFGKGAKGMVHVPVDLEWLSKRLVWVDAEDADASEEVPADV